LQSKPRSFLAVVPYFAMLSQESKLQNAKCKLQNKKLAPRVVQQQFYQIADKIV
jgi:hypothetical protein